MSEFIYEGSLSLIKTVFTLVQIFFDRTIAIFSAFINLLTFDASDKTY